MKRLGGLVLVVLALGAGSAEAAAIVLEQPAVNPYQRWADESKAPVPAVVRVREGQPADGVAVCGGLVLGCASVTEARVFVSTVSPYRTFFHEVGHIVDYQRPGLRTSLDLGSEAFADLYSVCARKGLRPPYDALTLSAKRHLRSCRAIRS